MDMVGYIKQKVCTKRDPLLRIKMPIDWGRKIRANIHQINVYYSLTVWKQTIGLKMSKWSAQVTISKDRHGANKQAKTGSVHIWPNTQQEVCQGRKAHFGS